jgi:hypothetical protein
MVGGCRLLLTRPARFDDVLWIFPLAANVVHGVFLSGNPVNQVSRITVRHFRRNDLLRPGTCPV